MSEIVVKKTNPVSVAVVDDHSIIRKSIRRILEKEGFLVEDFGDARSIINYLRKHPVDLVLSDIYMPEQTGFEVLRFVRGRSIASDIPVIFVTGEATRDDLLKAVEQGATDYLLKPFEAPELLSKVNKVLEKYRNPDEITLRIRQAETAFLTGDFEKSQALFQALIRMDPKNARLYTDLAQVENAMGDADKAIIYLNKAITINPLYFQAMMAASDILIASNRKDEAISYLLKELNLSGKRPYRRMVLADLYMFTGNTKQGLEQMRLALIDNPQDETLLLHMAEIQLKANDPEKSMHYYLKTRRQNPQSKRALEGIVELCAAISDIERGIRIFTDLLSLNSRQADVLLARAKLYALNTDDDKAMQDINKACSMCSGEIEPLKAKGHFLLKSKRNEEAAKIWEEISQLAPEADNFAFAGLSFLRLSKYNEAIVYYDKAVLLAPENYKYNFNLGFCFEYSNKLKLAKRQYEQVLIICSTCKEARDALKRIEIKNNPNLMRAMQASPMPPQVIKKKPVYNSDED